MIAEPVPAGPVPVHPEAVPDRPADLRWVVAARTLPFVGVPARVPRVLADLLSDGTLGAVAVEPTAVRTTLGLGRSWRAEGDRVRTGLQAALADLDGWVAPAGAGPDDVLQMVVDEVVAGEVGTYVRSHGGRIEVVSVRAGVVEVRLSGACTHCPGSDSTLGDRFETAVRAGFPDVRRVVAQADAAIAGGRRTLSLFPVGRRRSS